MISVCRRVDTYYELVKAMLDAMYSEVKSILVAYPLGAGEGVAEACGEERGLGLLLSCRVDSRPPSTRPKTSSPAQLEMVVSAKSTSSTSRFVCPCSSMALSSRTTCT